MTGVWKKRLEQTDTMREYMETAAQWLEELDFRVDSIERALTNSVTIHNFMNPGGNVDDHNGGDRGPESGEAAASQAGTGAQGAGPT